MPPLTARVRKLSFVAFWRLLLDCPGILRNGGNRYGESTLPDKNEIFDQLTGLTTESRNPRTGEIDLAPPERILEMINDEDRLIADVVRGAIPEIARAVELVTASFHAGGRLFADLRVAVIVVVPLASVVAGFIVYLRRKQ